MMGSSAGVTSTKTSVEFLRAKTGVEFLTAILRAITNPREAEEALGALRSTIDEIVARQASLDDGIREFETGRVEKQNALDLREAAVYTREQQVADIEALNNKAMARLTAAEGAEQNVTARESAVRNGEAKNRETAARLDLVAAKQAERDLALSSAEERMREQRAAFDRKLALLRE